MNRNSSDSSEISKSSNNNSSSKRSSSSSSNKCRSNLEMKNITEDEKSGSSDAIET